MRSRTAEIHREMSVTLDDADVEAVYRLGAPEVPRSYAHGGIPADPDEVEILSVEWRGLDLTPLLTEAELHDIAGQILEDGPGDIAAFEPDPDRAYEDARDRDRD